MPRLVRTPDNIFRAEPGKDLFYVEFLYPGKQIFIARWELAWEEEGVPIFPDVDSSNPPGRQELLDWLAATLPEVKVEPLGPMEGSGFIEGGIDGRLRIDFDPESLAVFCDRWEEEDGTSLDCRWQCYCMSYDSWLSQRYPLTASVLQERFTLTIVTGEVVNVFSLAPLLADETGLPCTLGLYWDMDRIGLMPGVLLYRGSALDDHAWLPLDETKLCLPGRSGLTTDEIEQCRVAVNARRTWLMERFDWNNERRDITCMRFERG